MEQFLNSKQYLKNEHGLERLLGLAAMTSNGLRKSTIYRLAESDICPEDSGPALCEAVQKTPYWETATELRSGCLKRLMPDRLAAALVFVALDLQEPLPSLPNWLLSPALQERGDFANILGRIAFDVGHIDAGASQRIELSAIEMLKQTPEIFSEIGDFFYRERLAFSAEFRSIILEIALAREGNEEVRIAALNSLAATFLDLNRLEAALRRSREAIRIYNGMPEDLAKKLTPDYLVSVTLEISLLTKLDRHDEALTRGASILDRHEQLSTNGAAFMVAFSGFLGSLSATLSESGKHDEAIEPLEYCLTLFQTFDENSDEDYRHQIASSFTSLANGYSTCGRHDEALFSAEQAEKLLRQLAYEKPEEFLHDFAVSLSNLSSKCLIMQIDDRALEYAEKAVEIFEFLAGLRPHVFHSSLAMSLNVLAGALRKKNLNEKSFLLNERTLEIYLSLNKNQPGAYMPQIALARHNLSLSYSDFDKHERALLEAQKAIELYRLLAEQQPRAMLPELAESLNVLAECFSRLERFEHALSASLEAVRILEPFFSDAPLAYFHGMHKAIETYLTLCLNLGLAPEGELVSSIVMTLSKLREVDR